MSRYIICDNCGEKDDWAQSRCPFFPDGLVLQFREDNGSEDFVADLELCLGCKEALLKAFPNIAAKLDERQSK